MREEIVIYPFLLGTPGAQVCIFELWEHRSVLGVHGSTGLYWGVPGAQVPYWKGPWVILGSE